MRKSCLLGAVCAYIVLVSASVNAAFIVDTGPGPGGVVGGTMLSATNFIAGQFTLASDFTLSSVEGWVSLSAINTFGTVVIYSDGGNIPGTELFSGIFEGAGSNAQWLGASGLAWNLAAGTYWAAFEVRSGQALAAAMPDPSVNPLTNDAFKPSYSNDWILFNPTSLGIGLRIQSVPVPAAAWLFGSGLLGLIGIARRKKAA